MKPIPHTDLQISPIALGTMTFGTPVASKDAIRLIHHAIAQGINHIDTANMYEGYRRYAGSAGGVAEEIIGQALKDLRREDVILASKLGMKVGSAPEDEGTSPAAIRKQLEVSLCRLHTDYLDLYYLHKPDSNCPMEETLNALAQMIQHGKIRHYGVSNYRADQLAALLQCADQNVLPRPVVCQPPLSLLKPDACNDLLPLCQQEEIAVIPYQIYQGGLLTGKYHRDIPLPANSRAAEKPDWMITMDDQLFDQLDTIAASATAQGMTMPQYALQWVLAQPAVVSAIVGVKHTAQLDAALDILP